MSSSSRAEPGPQPPGSPEPPGRTNIRARGIALGLALGGGAMVGATGPWDAGLPRWLLAFVWVLSLAGLACGGRARTLGFAAAALAVLVAWSVHPACWVFGAGILGLAT